MGEMGPRVAMAIPVSHLSSLCSKPQASDLGFSFPKRFESFRKRLSVEKKRQ
jgi:hypothetical protein